jgi:VWFA-related protein
VRIAGPVVALLGLILSLYSGLGLSAGQQQYPGAIRSAVTLVPVNVTVTDKDNKPVTDLKKEDFTILEDGVRQTIGHFLLQRMTAAAPDAGSGTVADDGKALLRKVPTASLVPQSRRVFVLVLGRFVHPGISQGLDDLIRFVRRELLPQDRVAVMAWNRATDFSTNREQIVQVLERFKKGRQGIDAKMRLRFSGDAAVYGGGAVPANLQAEIDAIFVAPGAINARNLPPGGAEDIARLTEQTRRTTDAIRQRDAATQSADLNADIRSRTTDTIKGGRDLGGADFFDNLDAAGTSDLPYDEFVSASSQTLQEIENIYRAVEYLRYVDGEKHLLFFTEAGLFLPRLEHDLSLAAMANDARVTIETFQAARGSNTANLPSAEYSTTSSMAGFVSGDRTRSGAGVGGIQTGVDETGGVFSRMFALQTLRNIAQLTGGRSSFRGSISQGLDALNSATRVEYLLGFYPSNASWDGKYRKIAVKVSRPGLTVSYRHGYYARQSLQPYDRKAFLTYSRIVAAASYDQEIRDIAVRAEASPLPAVAGQPREMKLVIVIDPSRVPFKVENDLHVATIDVTIFYGGAGSRSLGDTWRTLQLKVPNSAWPQVQQEGIVYSLRLPATDRGDIYKVIVYSYDADLLGVTDATIKK